MVNTDALRAAKGTGACPQQEKFELGINKRDILVVKLI